MKSITRQKPFEEIKAQLDGLDRVFIIGCGTCPTMTRTGDIYHIEIIFLDYAIEMDIEEVQSRGGSPMAEQARFNVIYFQRLFE